MGRPALSNMRAANQTSSLNAVRHAWHAHLIDIARSSLALQFVPTEAQRCLRLAGGRSMQAKFRIGSYVSALLAVALLMVCLPQRAAADEDDPPGRVARLRYLSGSVS